MSGAPNIQKIREAEQAIEAFIAQEAEMRETFSEDGLDAEEIAKLDAILAKIETLKASVAKLRKEMERNKANWDQKAKRFDAYKEKAAKMLDFDDGLAEKAVRLQVDIESEAAMEHWADALMLFENAEEEIVPDWEEYERQFPASEVHDAYMKDFRRRRDAAEAAEGLTDEQALAITRLAESEYDAEKAAAAADYVRANELLATVTEALVAIETELGTAPAANLSGAKWFNANQASYPNSKDLGDLESSFQTKVTEFKAALEAAGASTEIGSTLRDSKRAALMHYSWRVGKKEIKAADVPAIAEVDINFDHGADDLSVAKALEMVGCFNIVHRPSLNSNHTRGTAIDWEISWSGDLTIKNKAGEDVEITSSPANGTNTDLHPVGATYGVHKLVGDAPHWSHDGN